MKHPEVSSSPLPPTPEVALAIFGDRLGLAERYVAELADTGISHGLIGPREAPRLWDRHVLGCAVLQSAFPFQAIVADIGSGAGLPGIVLGIVRPDLQLVLVEPLHRRVVWLQSTVERLELDNVTVHEGRAESLWGVRRFPVVTARAVARIGALSGRCLPLLEAGGRLVAMKGASARLEVEEDGDILLSAGGAQVSIATYGEDLLEVPTTAVVVAVDRAPDIPSSSARPRGHSTPGNLSTSRGSTRRRQTPDRRAAGPEAGRSEQKGARPEAGAASDDGS